MRFASLLLLSVLLSASNAFAQTWSELSNGQHSFKSLGTEFYVDVPVRRIPNAKVKLAFINREVIERLGLELPSDPAEVEKLLLNHFAWEVDPEKKSKKVWFATHYLDANKKEVGGALGDGRALWTGELKLERPDGKILYVDGVQKGVGPTPLAWINNPSHSDGRQNTNELIVSGIRSMADLGNELDSTADIAGFTITTPNGDVRSMTLRVGRQTRPATIRYHKDNPANAVKIIEYIVKRDLGLPLETVVTKELFLEWQRQFVINNAENLGRAYPLNGFYEHPTAGNKTSSGGNIDMNGRQFMDAYHAQLTYFFNGMKVGNQVYNQAGYGEFINEYMVEANYRPDIDYGALTKKSYALFYQVFRETAIKHFLRNLGFDEADEQKLSPVLKRKLFNTVTKLMNATGNKPVSMYLHNDSVLPAAFDTRKVLKGTLAAMALPTPEARASAMAELYRGQQKWNSTKDTDYMTERARYEAVVSSIVESLGGKVLPTWLSNAKKRVKLERHDNTSDDGLWNVYVHPIRLKAESGELGWQEISRLMQQAASIFIDGDPLVRNSAMLKPKLPILAPTCSSVFGKAG